MFTDRNELVENFKCTLELVKADAKAMPKLRGNATFRGGDRLTVGRRASAYAEELQIMARQFDPRDPDYDWAHDTAQACAELTNRMWFV